MKRICYVSPKYTVVLEVNNLTYWLMGLFGWQLWIMKTDNKIRGLHLDITIYDEVDKKKEK